MYWIIVVFCFLALRFHERNGRWPLMTGKVDAGQARDPAFSTEREPLLADVFRDDVVDE